MMATTTAPAPRGPGAAHARCAGTTARAANSSTSPSVRMAKAVPSLSASLLSVGRRAPQPPHHHLLPQRCGHGHHRQQQHRHQRRLGVVVRASTNLYEVLGVGSSASTKEIKSAYRSKAKKLHPDVNKAADASERFLECKMAYQVLSNPDSRADYDRKQRWGSSSSSSSSSGGGWGGRRKASAPDEEFYGLDDFFRDLDKEISAYSGSSRGDLFGTLARDLVEALEEGLQDLESELGAVSGSMQEEFAKYQYDPETGRGWWEASWEASDPAGSSASRKTTQEEAARKAEEAAKRAQAEAEAAMREVDDELADLKRRMGL